MQSDGTCFYLLLLVVFGGGNDEVGQTVHNGKIIPQPSSVSVYSLPTVALMFIQTC